MCVEETILTFAIANFLKCFLTVYKIINLAKLQSIYTFTDSKYQIYTFTDSKYHDRFLFSSSLTFAFCSHLHRTNLYFWWTTKGKKKAIRVCGCVFRMGMFRAHLISSRKMRTHPNYEMERLSSWPRLSFSLTKPWGTNRRSFLKNN